VRKGRGKGKKKTTRRDVALRSWMLAKRPQIAGKRRRRSGEKGKKEKKKRGAPEPWAGRAWSTIRRTPFEEKKRKGKKKRRRPLIFSSIIRLFLLIFPSTNVLSPRGKKKGKKKSLKSLIGHFHGCRSYDPIHSSLLKSTQRKGKKKKERGRGEKKIIPCGNESYTQY